MSRITSQAITLQEYRALEEAGLLKRPLTDPPIGASTAQRDLDATTSALHTEPDSPIPPALIDALQRTERKDVA